MYLHLSIYMYVIKEADNVPFRLLPIRQWPHDNS